MTPASPADSVQIPSQHFHRRSGGSGLFKLARLLSRATLRRIFRGAKTPRGAIFLIVGTLVFSGWLASALSSAFLLPRADPAIVRLYFPMVMLAYCVVSLVTTAGERAIAFTPAEVDFLFPGPFSRRQLLLYKIIRSAFAALFTATLFSFVFLRYLQHWLPGWIGMYLALMFMQLFSMMIVLLGQIVGEQAYTRGRKLALAGVIIAVAAVVLPGNIGPAHRDFRELLHGFATSTSGQVVLEPFSIFARILTARALFPDMVMWAAIAVAIDLFLVAIVVLLDARDLEAAARSGAKLYDRLQRHRRGGGLAARAVSARLRLPMLPRFGGAGAIAWRQLTSALRMARATLIMLVLLSVAVGPFLYASGAGQHLNRTIPGLLFWYTFLLANMLRFDFRGDLDHIDTLKALPIRPAAIVVAQLIAPVIVLSICQAVLLTSAGFILHIPANLVAIIVAFALSLNPLLIAVENLIFLCFPVRIAVVSPGDLQGFGRQMLVFLLRSLLMLLAASIAAGFGAAGWWLTDKSRDVFVIVTIVCLLLEFTAMIPLLVVAFRKFDPSVDTPA